MKVLIADSGSTKTDWCLLETGLAGPMEEELSVLLRFTTDGINPFQQSPEEIAEEVRAHVLPALAGLLPDEIQFYGAGCTKEKAPIVARALATGLSMTGGEVDHEVGHVRGSAAHASSAVEEYATGVHGTGFHNTEVHSIEMHGIEAHNIEVHTDMLAAARALCGKDPGIACILGTGSNSCYYDGRELRDNVSPLGFILGDEGSGAVLGRLLVGDLLKGQLTHGLREAFLAQYHLTPAEIIDRVYRRPFANRFLASFAPFLAEHREDEGIHRLLVTAFSAFLTRNVMHYPWRELPVHFVGSIAWYFQDELCLATDSLGMRSGQILQSPMEGLIGYHQKGYPKGSYQASK